MTAKGLAALARKSIKIHESREALIREYSQNVITVPGEHRWDYAIPENYTNYQDGFVFQDGEPYRGMPIVRYNGEILYLRWAVHWTELDWDEDEKLLLFDRKGHKYTFIVKKQLDPSQPNLSYYDFLPLVKKYEKKGSARRNGKA